MKAPELKEKLHESEKLIQEMTITWEEKLRKTEEIATVGWNQRFALPRGDPRVTLALVCLHRSARSSWRAWASPWSHQGSKWATTSASWST